MLGKGGSLFRLCKITQAITFFFILGEDFNKFRNSGDEAIASSPLFVAIYYLNIFASGGSPLTYS